MRKTLCLSLLLALVFGICLAPPALADSSTMTATKFVRVAGTDSRLFYADYTLAANSAGAYSQTTHATDIVNGIVLKVRTAPGAGAYSPTDAYDITLTDDVGLDIMGGALANRSATAVEWETPLASDGSSLVEAPVQGPLHINIASNSTPAATVTLRLYILRP
ncbi:MAG: hypothetical protein QMD09_04195 [Desulfatibacillaceae bacterium]|nr:hypothetical protein [Desulfatibacillaceae bacterium]